MTKPGSSIKNIFLSWKSPEKRFPLWQTSLIVSLAGHIILFSFFAFFNGDDFKKKRPMKFIDVELMQLPVTQPKVKSNPGKSNKKSAVLPPKKKKATTVKKKTKKATVAHKKKNTVTSKKSPAPSISKKRTSIKKKRAEIVKPNDLLKSARAKLHKDVEKRKDNTIKDRLKQMKQEMASKNRSPKAATEESTATADAQSADAFESYMNNIRVLIRENWAFTKSLAKKQENLVTDVQFTVLPSGQIEIDKVWLEKRSGNSRYDQSATNAVMKSNPLPPFPQGLPQKPLPVTMRFNLYDLM